MCVYSVIADYYKDHWNPTPNYGWPGIQPNVGGTVWPESRFTSEEIEALKELIKQSIKTDKVFKDCDCETPEKVDWLKKHGIDIAELHKEVDAKTIEWEYPNDCGYAYGVDGKRIAEVGYSGDGHFRAWLISAEILKKRCLGDFKTAKQAQAAVEKALDNN